MTLREEAMERPGERPLRLSGPADVIEAVPYLLGFAPAESLVILALRGPALRVAMTVRVDLADARRGGAAPFIDRARKQGVAHLLVAVFTDGAQGHPLPHADLIGSVRSAATGHGIDVKDALCVSGDLWWSYLCRETSCCPPAGNRVPKAGAVAAELVLHGEVAMASRDELAALLAPDPVRCARVVSAMAATRRGPVTPASRATAVALLDRALAARASDEARIEPDSAAALILAVQDVTVRDAVLDAGRRSRGGGAWSLWRELTTLAPAPERAAPAAMAACVAYQRGQGAMANVALDVAVAAAPGYPLAVLLGRFIQAALPPAALTDSLDRGARAARKAIAVGANGRSRPPGHSAPKVNDLP